MTVYWLFQLQELKANPHRNAKGIVIEAGLDKAKGPFATFIVQKGTLKRGDVVVCGEAFGKVYPKFTFLLKLHRANYINWLGTYLTWSYSVSVLRYELYLITAGNELMKLDPPYLYRSVVS